MACMANFISDCRYAARIIGAKVVDEDDEPLSFWEKIVVAAQILCGIIVVEHGVKSKGRDR
jgi:hypothetical protein